MSPRKKQDTHFLVSPYRSYDADHKSIFLLHAKMHCLSKRFDISSLIQLTLHKLHETLKHCISTTFAQNNARIADVVALADYTYGHQYSSEVLHQEVLEFAVILLSQVEGMPEYDAAHQELLGMNRKFNVEFFRLHLSMPKKEQ